MTRVEVSHGDNTVFAIKLTVTATEKSIFNLIINFVASPQNYRISV
jgi:hypothetical protein